MNKPSWGNAPEWANWLILNHGGIWKWYEFEPHFATIGDNSRVGVMAKLGRMEDAAADTISKPQIEKRPIN